MDVIVIAVQKEQDVLLVRIQVLEDVIMVVRPVMIVMVDATIKRYMLDAKIVTLRAISGMVPLVIVILGTLIIIFF